MTRPWEKDHPCQDCGNKDCGHGKYAQWKDWLYQQVDDDAFDELGEIALCHLFAVMCDLADKQAEEIRRLKDEGTMFEKIWNAIKHWDIDTSGTRLEYHGLNGDDVRVIIEALQGQKESHE